MNQRIVLRVFVVGLVSGMLLGQAPPVAAQALLEIPGIPGDSTGPLVDQIQVLSFGFDNTKTGIGKKPEVCGGKKVPSVQSLLVVKHLDKASPKLYEAAALGTTLPTTTLHLFKGGAIGEYATITLTDALVSAIQNGGPADGSDLIETATFSFASAQFRHVTPDPSGGPGTVITTTSWAVCE